MKYDMSYLIGSAMVIGALLSIVLMTSFGCDTIVEDLGKSVAREDSAITEKTHTLRVSETNIIKCGEEEEFVQFNGMMAGNYFSLSQIHHWPNNQYYPAASKNIYFYGLNLEVVIVSPIVIRLKCSNVEQLIF